MSIRIPAHALDDLITERLAALFDQPLTLLPRCRLTAQPGQLSRLAPACEIIAARLRQGARPTLQRLINRIEVDHIQINMKVSTAGLGECLELEISSDAPKDLDLTIDAQLLVGEQATELSARTLARLHRLPLSWEEQDRPR